MKHAPRKIEVIARDLPWPVKKGQEIEVEVITSAMRVVVGRTKMMVEVVGVYPESRRCDIRLMGAVVLLSWADKDATIAKGQV
jgi:hypothetical protein